MRDTQIQGRRRGKKMKKMNWSTGKMKEQKKKG